MTSSRLNEKCLKITGTSTLNTCLSVCQTLFPALPALHTTGSLWARLRKQRCHWHCWSTRHFPGLQPRRGGRPVEPRNSMWSKQDVTPGPWAVLPALCSELLLTVHTVTPDLTDGRE